MKRYDLIIIGAGPAGLSAAIEAAKLDMNVIIFDENSKPGGQLFKQIHKFFGSKEHMAKERGYHIGDILLEEANKYNVEVRLDSTVIGLYMDKEVVVKIKDEVHHFKGNAILIATGASENLATFPGWTLPGVIGAGAAQTMMNLHGIKPGNKVLMVGTGNVGLVVSYQLMQAGCEVVALIDALPRVGGYGVHASKVARCGVPFHLSHTITYAEGMDHVTGVEIAEVGPDWSAVLGSEKYFEVDTICLAVGLSPMSNLAHMAGCEMQNISKKGGMVPVVDQYGETSVPGIFVAGDVSGIEEASSAMIEGRIAGYAVAYQLGYLTKEEMKEKSEKQECSLESLRQGMFAPINRGKRLITTEEGFLISDSLLENGYIRQDEIFRYPGVKKRGGIHPVIECTQNIPCNPCQDACKKGCISIGNNITSLPVVREDQVCSGCGMCVANCSGQAIFLVNDDYEEGFGTVTMAYEFFPLPQVGDIGCACGRDGGYICEAEVVEVKNHKIFDHTNLLTIKVPVDKTMEARFYKRERENI